jgi:hypothetical protein
MKTGSFFKMMDSPFKMSIMNAYDKLQNKVNGAGAGAGIMSNYEPTSHNPLINGSHLTAGCVPAGGR